MEEVTLESTVELPPKVTFGTVEVFVEWPPRQGGDDESRIGAFLQELGLADDAAPRSNCGESGSGNP